jgi:parallel beta-helix repeat protein
VGGATAPARNVIAGNDRSGVLYSAGTGARIQGNRIGVGADGSTAVGNGTGVWIEAGATSPQIGGPTSTPGGAPGNVISGNHGPGVLIRQTGAKVTGNLIGTNAAGTAAVPNEGDGVAIRDGAHDALIGDAGGANVISGNAMAGVYISDSDDNLVRGNTIGLNRAGTVAIGNATGVELANGATGNRIGDSFGSVISGNRWEGVFVHGAGTTHNTLDDNLIGLRADGAGPVANGQGVVISGGAQENTVGDPLDLAGVDNTISGNTAEGVLITGPETNRNVVLRGAVGVRPDGVTAQPNDIGVAITGGARQNSVDRSTLSGNRTAGARIADTGTRGNVVADSFLGTTAAGAALPNGAGVIVTAGASSTALRRNRIARNTGSGVLVDDATTAGAELLANRIFANGKLGINLRPAAEAANVVTPNDAGDADTGPNDLQNFPVITAASGAATGTTVSGTLNSRPGQRYRIELFRNPVGSGAASEGETYAGAVTVTTDAAGNATWTLKLAGDRTGEVLRTTATRLATGDTSELSVSRTVD